MSGSILAHVRKKTSHPRSPAWHRRLRKKRSRARKSARGGLATRAQLALLEAHHGSDIPMAPSTWKCRTCSTVNWSTRHTCRHCQSSPERKDNKKDRKKSLDRDSANPLAAYEHVSDAPRARLVATIRHLSRAAVQRVNAGGCPFVSSGPLAHGQGRAVFTGSSAGESFQDAIRHCEGGGFAGQEGKGTVRCKAGARQGEVSPRRIEVRPTEAHPRSRLAVSAANSDWQKDSYMDDDVSGWREDGSSSWRCSSSVSWHHYTEDECTSGAHSSDQATPGLSEQVAALTGMLVQLQQEVASIASTKQLQEAPATPVQPNRSAAPTPSIPHRTRVTFWRWTTCRQSMLVDRCLGHREELQRPSRFLFAWRRPRL